jgi:branched-chain amino acid transport system ATP-binding protein
VTGHLLDVEALWTGYQRDTPVVRDLSLHVDAGEVVALLGPNGAGKTTTLLTVSGLVTPTRGSVRFAGRPVPGRRHAHTLARRGLAHVPEDRCLFVDLTAAENLRLAHTRHGAAIDEILDVFPELIPLLDRRAGLLSGGEQQMVALARALLQAPRLLMVDEMSLGLAPIIVDRLLPVLRRASDDGVAVLLVEQHIHMALEIADRAYVLAHGELVLEGPARDLARDHELVTASYLGESELERAVERFDEPTQNG